MAPASIDVLLDLERRGWDALCRSEGAAFYGDIMTGDALMVLAGGLVLDREGVVESLADAPAWESYDLSDARVIAAGEDAAAIVYRARAEREGQAEPFIAQMSSLYRMVDGRLRLVLYQQTVLEG